MILSFAELYQDKLLSSKVLYVCGSYSLFNNQAIDRMKKHIEQLCREKLKNVMLESENDLDIKEFDILLDFDEFMRNIKVRAFVGKWVCIVDYKMLTTKQKNQLKEYIKKPSENGLMVIESNDYVDYKDILKDRVIKQSSEVHALKLSYPSKTIVSRMVREELKDKHISEKAMQLFILRMGTNYDEFESMIHRVKDSEDKVIDLDLMKSLLAGVENYAVDDFLLALLKPPRGRRTSRKPLFTMMGSLIEDLGAVKLLRYLIRSIDNLIMFRVLINDGYVPGDLTYSLVEFKEQLDKDSPILRMSDFAIRKHIKIALRTSLRDLFYMKLLLKSCRGYSDEQVERVLISTIHRALLSVDNLCIDIGIRDVIEENLYKLNRVFLDYPRMEEVEDIEED